MGINLIPELALEIIYSDFLFNTRMSVWFPWCMATQSWLRTHEPGPPPLLPPAGNVSSVTDGSDSQKATCPVLSALCTHWTLDAKQAQFLSLVEMSLQIYGRSINWFNTSMGK